MKAATAHHERPDVEAYVGKALRLMALELQPRLHALLQEDDRTRTADPYELLYSIIGKSNRDRVELLRDTRVLSAAYRALELRNRWAHPQSHEGMEPSEALRGIDELRSLVEAFGGSAERLREVRDALASAPEATMLEEAPWQRANMSMHAPSSAPPELDHALPEHDAPGLDEVAISSRMTLRPDTGPAYAAAEVVREQMLESPGSAFGGDAVWTVQNLQRLQLRLLDQKEGGLKGFLDRYCGQLADADLETVQLGAEALYVHFWINAKSMSGDTKRAAIRRVLSLRSATTPIPPRLALALDMGLVRTGASFHQYRWSYLRVVVDAARGIQSSPTERREQLLEDPWRFREWLLSESDGLAQRHALLHLLYPDTFEAIISVEHKRLILKRLGRRLQSRSGNDDRDLFELRRVLAPEFGPRYDYYRPPVVELWQGPPENS